MKKWLLLFAAIPLIHMAHAQEKPAGPGLYYPTSKASVLIGSNVLLGGAGFSNSGTYYNLGLTPRAGYFVANNLAAGIELNGQFSGSPDDYKSQSYGGSLFARYYFGKAAQKNGAMVKTRFFAEAGAGYFSGTSRFENSDKTTNHYSFSALSLKGMAGMNYFINKNVALEAGIFYRHSTKDDVNNRRLYDPTQLGVSVGLQFFLGRKK